jgi:hypothetical protein
MKYLLLILLLAPGIAEAQSRGFRALTKCGHLADYALLGDIDTAGLTFNNLRDKISPEIKRISALKDEASKRSGCEAVKVFVERYSQVGSRYRLGAERALPALEKLGETECRSEIQQDSQDIMTSSTNMRDNYNRACGGN